MNRNDVGATVEIHKGEERALDSGQKRLGVPAEGAVKGQLRYRGMRLCLHFLEVLFTSGKRSFPAIFRVFSFCYL